MQASPLDLNPHNNSAKVNRESNLQISQKVVYFLYKRSLLLFNVVISVIVVNEFETCHFKYKALVNKLERKKKKQVPLRSVHVPNYIHVVRINQVLSLHEI